MMNHSLLLTLVLDLVTMRQLNQRYFFNGGQGVYKIKNQELTVIDNDTVGMKSAYPSSAKSPNLSYCHKTSGTSNATALASRYACKIYDVLEKLENTKD